MLRPAILACIVLLAFSCGSSQKVTPSDDQGPANVIDESSMENISNPVYEENKVRFSVISNGCTNTSDFSVDQSINNGRCELTVVRNTPDLCRKASALIDIELAWPLPSDCTGLDVVFLNPVIDESRPNLQRRLGTERVLK